VIRSAVDPITWRREPSRDHRFWRPVSLCCARNEGEFRAHWLRGSFREARRPYELFRPRQTRAATTSARRRLVAHDHGWRWLPSAPERVGSSAN